MLSQDPSTYGDIIGYRYNGPTGSEIQWISADTQALVSGVKKALGEVDTEIDWTDPGTGAVSRITVPKNFSVHPLHFSANLQTWIFEKDGPTTPPEYYLYRVGKPVKLIGRSRPQLDPRLLGQSQLVQITTRDGLKIPAFVHKPESSIWGPGPYPAIVLPHGGPWNRDSWVWDSTGWVAYFTARGYVVIQPQYRGSTGWGGALWAAGDNQWGLKMSDDLDDAANWLVSNGLAKPGHIVMHGYSYGGFAAYVAATRGPSSPYRCVIAGGAGGDLTRWRLYASESHYLREYQGVTMDGYSPIDHIEKINVPLLVYHSELDHNVDLQEAKMMVDRLQAAGKAVKFIELKDQDHTIYTWSPANTATILTSIDDFLTHDCGPGGVNGPDAVASR